jgi:hypothetical protein
MRPVSCRWVVPADAQCRTLRRTNVARKLGFTYWKRAHVDGFLVDMYRRNVG